MGIYCEVVWKPEPGGAGSPLRICFLPTFSRQPNRKHSKKGKKKNQELGNKKKNILDLEENFLGLRMEIRPLEMSLRLKQRLLLRFLWSRKQ